MLSTTGEWNWVADPQALADAKTNLQESQDELKQYDIDIARQAQEEKVQMQIDNLQEELDINQQGYDDKISILKDYLDKEKDMITLTNDLMLESYTALYEKIQSLYPDLSLGGATISGGESDTTPKLDLGKKYEYLGSLIGGSDVEKSDWAKQEAIKYRGYLPTAMGAQLEGTNVSIMNLTVENVEDWDDFIEQATNIANTQ